MAGLGARNLRDLIGRSDLLDQRHLAEYWKSEGIDFTKLFHKPEALGGATLYHSESQDHHLEAVLDRQLITLAEPAFTPGTPAHTDRKSLGLGQRGAVDENP